MSKRMTLAPKSDRLENAEIFVRAIAADLEIELGPWQVSAAALLACASESVEDKVIALSIYRAKLARRAARPRWRQ